MAVQMLRLADEKFECIQVDTGTDTLNWFAYGLPSLPRAVLDMSRTMLHPAYSSETCPSGEL